MSEAVTVAVISGGVSLLGVLISNLSAWRKSEQALRTAQAVTEAQLAELTREVREYNQQAAKMPVVEEQIRVIHTRLHNLEAYQRPMS